jgi:hypothetical protein
LERNQFLSGDGLEQIKPVTGLYIEVFLLKRIEYKSKKATTKKDERS